MKKPLNQLKTRLKYIHDPYLLVNLSFFLIFLGVILYAWVFDPCKENHPIPCVFTMITGESCASCGLSRGLSFMLRLDIASAKIINPYSPGMFLFFSAQLLLRALFSVLYTKGLVKNSYLIVADVSISLSLFLLAFLPLYRALF